MIEALPFQQRHLDAAAGIAFAHWGKEHRSADEATRRLIYRYLIRYYFHPSSPLSLAAVENGTLCAFLLAHRMTDPPYPAAAWLEPRLRDAQRPVLREYTAYLDGNRLKEEAALLPGEAVMALFASRKPGCGRLLIQAFMQCCRREKVPSFLLWTDETCDFSYYCHNGFTEVAKMPTDPVFDPPRTLTTFLFRKKI